MIPYEDLCAALASYRNRSHGGAAMGDEDTYHGHQVPVRSVAPAETVITGDIPEPVPSIRSHGGVDGDTHVGGGGFDGTEAPARVFDDHSNELDIDDVLADEDASQ